MVKSKNALTCCCGLEFKNCYQKEKHQKLSSSVVCKQKKKRGAVSRHADATAVKRDQM